MRETPGAMLMHMPDGKAEGRAVVEQSVLPRWRFSRYIGAPEVLKSHQPPETELVGDAALHAVGVMRNQSVGTRLSRGMVGEVGRGIASSAVPASLQSLVV